MGHSVLDLPALLLAGAITLLIAAVLIVAHGEENKRRAWMAAGVLFAVLLALGLLDLVSRSPRDTHVATVVLGAAFPVAGTVGVIRAARRVRHRWLRWILVFLATFALFFAGVLIGGTVVPRYLG
jgi:ABC-type Mn2+/Zn2+ transport system permease subunit